MLSFEFLLRLSAILKLDFLKSPGKSGSARPPRGMKLGNLVTSVVKTQPQQSIDFTKFKIAALEKFLNVKRRFFNQFLVQ